MELFAARCPWYVAGPLLGLMIVGLFGIANRPFGAAGGWIELQEWLGRVRSGPTWRVFFLLGVVLGGALFSQVTGGPSPTTSYGSFDTLFGSSLAVKAPILLGAGMLIGFGVRQARGCTSGHGLCGNSLGSPASFVSTCTFMATAIVSAHLLTWLLGGRR